MSTIQPTPPSGATAQGPATTTARITSGVQALANTRPGGTVQVQVTSVSPGGQVTFSAPGGEITVQTSGSNSRQTPSQGTGQSGGQAGNQAGGQSTGQSAEQTQGRAPATLKPGDIYTLRAGPRGSDTVSLTPQRAAPPPSADPAAPPPPRAEGSVPARLVPGAITTATIIPRPGDAP
ncbi:MAG: hypothetical protein ISP41_08720, partial [Alphaproteobacteria bacterium]|nr:hypothetical protein [Alphaproteobacteria bacterium]